MKENSIEEDIKNAEHFIKTIKTDKEYKEENGWHGYYNKEIVELARMLEHILSDYKRVLKENEELKNKLKEKDKIIDLMAVHLIGATMFDNDEPIIFLKEEKMKQYFERQAKNDTKYT